MLRFATGGNSWSLRPDERFVDMLQAGLIGFTLASVQPPFGLK